MKCVPADSCSTANVWRRSWRRTPEIAGAFAGYPNAYDPKMELRGKRVLITGASRGIGESLAHAFAGAGARVALVARDRDCLASLAAELGGTGHPVDLSDSDEVAGLIHRVEIEG